MVPTPDTGAIDASQIPVQDCRTRADMGHARQYPTFNLGTGRYFKMAQYSSKHFTPTAGAWMRALQVGAAISVAVLAGCATKATTGADSGNFISGGRGGTNGGTDVSKLSGRGGGRDAATGVAGGSQGSGAGGDSAAGHGANGAGGVAGAGSTSLSGDSGAAGGQAGGQAGGIAGSNGRGVNGGAGGDNDGSGTGGVAGANGAGGVGSVAGAGGAGGRSGTGAGGTGDGSAMGSDGMGGDSMGGAGGVNGGVAGGVNGGVAGGVNSGVAGGAPGVGGTGVGGTDGTGGRRGTGVGGDDDMVVGMIDAPGNRAQVDEDVTPQTLGGMLPMTVGVDEEGQFDFDKAVLRPEVKDVLDALATRLAGAQYDRLDIIGYTDRLGSDEYNQNLSERRAWAVARYLIEKGVPLSKMRVQGRGERNSVMVATECADLAHDDLIMCLQRDRRVEIEASIRRAHVKVD
jgi:outer membrane protein OmpA-like peptidoglycan-associated protein